MSETPTTPPSGDETVTPQDAAPGAPLPEAEVSPAPPAPQPAPEAPSSKAAVPLPGSPAPARPPAPGPKPLAETPLDPRELAEASKFGRVTADGTVYVSDGGAERSVGQFPNAPASEAMAFYVRRYLDLVAQIRLFESRLPNLQVRDLDQALDSLRKQTAEPQAVGDLAKLRTRVELAEERAAERRTEIAVEREAARAEALATRTAIVEAVEAIAAQDIHRTQWRDSGEHLRGLLDQWKDAQRNGPRLEKGLEDELWKRFAKARTVFDRNRRQFFAERDAEQSQAITVKEQLIARAEEISTSTDWGRTSGEYRELMAQWKAAGRGRRREEDRLWERFRAAQQRFFDARDQQNQAIDEEYGKNLEVKLQILAEAEELVKNLSDLKATREKMRALSERWEDAGRVPRADVSAVEGRMRAVEQAISRAEQAEWTRSNPETKARVSQATAQLAASIAQLEGELAAANAKGDSRKVKEIEEALTARRAWLTQISS